MARYGIYKGVVTNGADPEGLGRLKAQVPQVFGMLESDWAWPASPNIADVDPLAPGDPVWILFEGGDPHKPVWLGTWHTVGAELDVQPVLAEELADLRVLIDEMAVESAVMDWLEVNP